MNREIFLVAIATVATVTFVLCVCWLYDKAEFTHDHNTSEGP